MPQDLDALLSRYKSGRGGARDRYLLKEYGIDAATYEDLLRSQGGVCAICHRDESVDGQPLSVDHDHASGAVRGLLCRGCNAALGNCQDDPNRLRAAALYLDHNGVAGARHQPRR